MGRGAMLIEEGSERLLDGVDVSALEETRDSVYLLTADLVLVGYNQAYVAFAQANSARHITAISPFGTRLTDAMSEPLASAYRDVYRRVLRSGTPFSHCFECPAPTVYRQYRQVAYPVAAGRGLLVTNSLVTEYPLGEGRERVIGDYADDAGVITECSHCRRLANPRTGGWDWVPAHVADPDPATSHGLCPYCLEHYHPLPASR